MKWLSVPIPITHARWVNYTEAEGSLVLGSQPYDAIKYHSKITADYNVIVASPPNTNLLLVNKQAHEETLKIG